MKENQIELYFFLIVFIAVLVLSFFLFLPFLGALAVAAVLAVIFYPLFNWFIKKGLRWHSLAALLTVLAVFFVVFVPLSFLGFLLFEQAQDLFFELNNGGESALNGTLVVLEGYVQKLSPGFSLDFNQYVRQGLFWVTQSFGSIFASTAQAVLAFLIGLIALFYFIRDGAMFRTLFIRYSPLRDEYDSEIIKKIKRTINSILKGSILVALIQGVLSGIGFAIFGIPNAILWGSVAALGALIPGVGTTIVLVPAVLFLFFFVGIPQAVGLLIWGAFAVGLVDNFLGPILIGRSVRIHPLFVLLSVLGGLHFFGPVGFLLGPIVFSLLIALAEIYTFLVRRE